jgi:hypothetical protein
MVNRGLAESQFNVTNQMRVSGQNYLLVIHPTPNVIASQALDSDDNLFGSWTKPWVLGNGGVKFWRGTLLTKLTTEVKDNFLIFSTHLTAKQRA